MEKLSHYSALLTGIIHNMYKNPGIEFITYDEPKSYGIKITDKETGTCIMEIKNPNKDFEALSLELLLGIKKTLQNGLQ